MDQNIEKLEGEAWNDLVNNTRYLYKTDNTYFDEIWLVGNEDILKGELSTNDIH